MGTVLFFLSFLFVFGLLIFFHEFGHFIMAKLSNVEVLEFGFGFPPALYKKKRGNTVYSVNAIPLGGFVRLLGEDGSEANNPKSFAAQNKLVKAKIISAGVLMNLILAWFVFSLLYTVGFSPMIPDAEKHLGVHEHNYIVEIQEGTPASKAGILKNDELLKINGKEIKNLGEFRAEVKNNIGKEVKIEVSRGKEIKSFSLVPFKETIEGQEMGRIGIQTTDSTRADNIFWASTAGFSETVRLAKMTVLGIAGFFGKLFTTFTVGENVVGPVGIAALTDQVRQLGFLFLLQFVAILSISLALVNILPIPGLDGGHLLFIILEKIRGKDVNLAVKNTLTIIGLAFLLILILLITPKDLSRFGIIDSVKNFFGF